MPTTSSVAGEVNINKNSVGGANQTGPVQNREHPSPQSPSADGDLDFARMLAATVRSQAEDSLASLAAPASGKGRNGVDSRFAQLGFLTQPSSFMLPPFVVASRWQQQTTDSAPSVARTAAAPDSTPGTEPTPGIQPGATNPFTPLMSSQALTGSQGVTGSNAISRLDSMVNRAEKLSAAEATGRIGRPTDFSAFPRPVNDNGRGIHWIPTPSQSQEVVDKYVAEAESMGIKWVTLLNDGVKRGDNDYLVDKLNSAGIEPVMRLYTDGGAAIEGDVQALVRHYGKKGVNYFQLYNEPNLRIENQGKAPDPEAYAAKWLADAREVVAAGGLPGFGSLSPTPGLAPGAAPGDMDDLRFLKESLQEVVRLGGQDVLDKTWLSVHNYGHAHLRVRDYDKVVNEVLGRSLPQVGTEAGIYPGDTLSQSQATEIVADAYRYLPQREEYYFAYTYWIIANDPGQGHADAAWNHQALFRPDGNSPIVDVLRQEV